MECGLRGHNCFQVNIFYDILCWPGSRSSVVGVLGCYELLVLISIFSECEFLLYFLIKGCLEANQIFLSYI